VSRRSGERTTALLAARRRCGRTAHEMLAQIREQGFVDWRGMPTMRAARGTSGGAHLRRPAETGGLGSRRQRLAGRSPGRPPRCRRSAPRRWAHRGGTTQRAARSARGPRPARPRGSA
jgi:hypothetical protein